MGFDPNVEIGIVNLSAILILHQLSFILSLHDLFFLTVAVIFLVADSLEPLMHMQQHRFVGG